jgi:hypothetical protein
MTTAESEEERATEEPGALAKLAAILIVLVAFAGIYFLVKDLYPEELDTKADPGFIDSIFDNKVVVLFARLLLVSGALVLAFGGVFIIASTVVRMKNKDWLRRAGPFEVSETAVTELEEQVDFWRNAALEGQEEVAELRQRLQESDELIEELHVAMDDG